MAGRQTIQRVPRGLLDMLLMKGTGDTPTELAAQVLGTIDLSQLYQNDKMEQVTGTTSTINLNGFWGVGSGMTVPAGELWLLHNLSAYFVTNLAAGEEYQIGCAIFRAQWTYVQLSPNYSPLCSGINDRPAVGWQFERPEILRPSDNLGVNCTHILAGAHVARVTAWITRLTT